MGARELPADRRRLVVAMLDLDHFKAFNDSHGHQAGDRLLKHAAAAWLGEIRAVDTLARYGGEEFAVALPGCTVEDARTVLERLRAAIPEAQTCSIGAAAWDGAEDVETLVGRADRALYAAKAGGRDGIRVARPPQRARRAAPKSSAATASSQ